MKTNYMDILIFPWTKVYYGDMNKPHTMKEEGKTPIFFINTYTCNDEEVTVYFTPLYAFTSTLTTAEVIDAISEKQVDFEEPSETEIPISIVARYDEESDCFGMETVIDDVVTADIERRITTIFSKFFDVVED